MSKFIVFTLVFSFWIYYIHSEVIQVVKRSVCKHNEMQVECAHCGPKRCDDLGSPVPCIGANGICRPECVCIDGYVRDTNGTCIPKDECPSCGGDFNATSGCGNHCGNSCSDYKEVNKTCLTGCRYNSCDCKEGYVYNEHLKFCVLPVDC
ncbi:venom serine protease inhibitor-like [Galleria mellonella]|uniref:Venom serine protease inhibitor-like n=1 Tax=Galleria mellonella TaxID=7137 RepID=A0A6J1X2A2_GALME|nr:venom serine protease inhibitor-like [Galleria mellonella]